MELCAFQSEEKIFHHTNVDHPIVHVQKYSASGLVDGLLLLAC